MSELASIYEAEGRSGLVAWVKTQRESLWMVNATQAIRKRHIDLVNRGRWPEELDPLDWKDPITFEALKEYLAETTHSIEADRLSPELQRLAGDILAGKLVPRKRAKTSTASTTENLTIAYDCIKALGEIGIAAHVSKDWRVEGDLTGCSIVAEGLGVSEPIVEKWWKAYRKWEKARAE